MVTLGSKGSRMRDFFDIHALALRQSFDGNVLATALRATIARRGTPIPLDVPLALTPAFAEVEGKRAQWAGFVRRSRLVETPASFDIVLNAVAGFVGPVLAALARQEPFDATLPAGGPWEEPARS